MKILLAFACYMLLLLPDAFAATTPQPLPLVGYSGVHKSATAKKNEQVASYLNKHPRLQQLALKLTQKKWFQKWMAKADDRQRTKDTMGTIAFISGILIIVSLFTLPAAALILVPAAIVCGIIGVSKNQNRRSYIFALIGLILGGVYVLALAVLLAFALAWVNGW